MVQHSNATLRLGLSPSPASQLTTSTYFSRHVIIWKEKNRRRRDTCLVVVVVPVDDDQVKVLHYLPDHDVVELDILHVHGVKNTDFANLDGEDSLRLGIDGREDFLARTLKTSF